MDMLNHKTTFLVLIVFFCVCVSFSSTDIPDDFPIEYSNCSCHWTDWMNSDSPVADDIDDETYRSLRSHGYQFCEKPVAIQCYSVTDNQLIDPQNSDVTCDVDIGLKCTFFCTDFRIRVACCYCPPPAIGPPFQIASEQNGGCLAVRRTTADSTGVLSLDDKCLEGDKSQSWTWVSQSQIKSESLRQCITVVNDVNGSPIHVTDCDSADRHQEWTYDRLSKSLSSGIGYLSSLTGHYVASESSSRWMGKVDVGKLDLSLLKGMPCNSEPTPPSDGSVICSSGAYQGSVCQYSCDAGYALPNNQPYSVVCRKNQKYNGSTPACTRITCQSLASPSHGNIVCSNEFNLNSACQFTCDFGYKLVGTSELTCMGFDKWDGTAPICQRIVCIPDLTSQSLEHGAVSCNDTSFLNSKCSYTCNTGYQLHGSAARSCGEDGTWSASSPTCRKVQCPAIDSPSHAVMTCTDEFQYLSTCRFSCNVGHTLVGSDATTCQSDKSWGSALPSCERKTCSSLDQPRHGRFTCSDGEYFASTCTFQCVEGFQLSHDHPLVCTENGWDRGAPVCQQITCPRMFPPSNGNVSCDKDELYGSECVFSCSELYSLKGAKTLSCNETGWSSTAPSCSKIKCPPYPSPKHGETKCIPNNEVQSVCVTTCSEGFALKPPNSYPTCERNGHWSSGAQRCGKIQCRSLTLLNGKVSCSDRNNYNSKCQFTCNSGYNLYGSIETTCEANGWSQQVPSCGRVVCLTQVAQPTNGQVECNTEGMISCTFSCNRGFTLKGINHTECQSDGRWSNPNPPTCKRVTCSAGVMTPTNGRVHCSTRALFGSVCNYTCDHGYHLKGEKLITCTDSGEWDAPVPTCERIACPALSSFSHGEVQCTDDNFFSSTCTFTCSAGYERIGPETSQCQVGKTWSSVAPYCEKITCSPGFSNPSNGRVTCTDLNNHGSVCHFTCEFGFRLEGKAETKCGSSGEWSVRSAPSCMKITCEQRLTPFEGGSESCDGSNGFQSVCTYTCNEGYELAGAATRECNQDGNWNNIRPSCRAIECPSITIENAQVTCSAESRFGSECVFECASGYRRVGAEKVSCTLSKTWNPTTFPVCEYVVPVSPTTVPTTNATTPSSAPTSEVKTSSQSGNSPGNIVSTKKTPSATQPPTTTTTTTTPDVNSEAIGGKGEFPIIPVVAGVGVFVLIVIGIVTFLLLKRRRRKPHSSRSNYHDRSNDSQLQRLLPNGSSSRKFASILVERLESEFSRKHADDDKLFREEFASLPEAHGNREQGGKIINKEKNRYTNIIPYDHSRVVLPRSNNSDSDYINASFVDGYKHKGKFISAQGPKDNTISDFWRMIWDQNVSTIIMVTKLQEGKEVKCAQYWPQYGKATYDDLEVCFTAENHLVDYTVRKFTVQQVSDEGTLKMRRNLVQYHFTSWPDFGVPKSPSGMLKFLRKIKHGSPTGYGAIVVHCSAGVGRTGTFISLDAMLDMMAREGKIDVFGFVSQMRTQRPEMVQTEQQYIFIYQALLEHHLYGDTEVDVADLTSYIDDLNKRLPGNVTGMEHDFKKLTTIPIQKKHMRAGNHPANMRKNRVLLIVPYDWNRVILPIKPGVENSDYINASYIDGYRQKDTYIATQGPLAHTVEDFWRLIWETKSASVVMLTKLVERGQTKCEQYWPDSDVMIYGDLSVEHIGENELDNCTTRDFVLTSLVSTDDRKQILRQFHYHAWPENGPPVSGYSMIGLVEQVQKQQQTSGNHPIVVHCSAGAGRTGSFCALSTALEQVKAEGILDMFQIVKCLRMQRPHMVQTLEQYEFCFRAVQEYVDSMSEYYNFK